MYLCASDYSLVTMGGEHVGDVAVESEGLWYQLGWGIVYKETAERRARWLHLAANELSGGSTILISPICFYRRSFVDFKLGWLFPPLFFFATQYKHSQALSSPCLDCLLFIWDCVGAKFKLD